MPGWRCLADCLTQPNFADADTERERRAFLQELRGRGISASSVSASSAAKSWDLPSELVSQVTQPRDEGAVTALRLLKNSLLPTHPYRLDATTQSVASLTRRRLLEFVRRAYPLNRLTLAIVGDVDPAVVIEQLETRLGPATPTAASPPAVVESVLDPAPTQQHLLFSCPVSTRTWSWVFQRRGFLIPAARVWRCCSSCSPGLRVVCRVS
jgi:hypothetical protein